LTKTVSPFSTKVAAITTAVRDGVLEKWLTYAKCEHLTEFQIWRVHKMRSKLAFFQEVELGQKLAKLRMQDEMGLLKVQQFKVQPKSFWAHGPPITEIYPLLDPDTAVNRIARH